MKSKDQTLLEEAYKKVKKGEEILIRGVGVYASDFDNSFDYVEDFSDGFKTLKSEFFAGHKGWDDPMPVVETFEDGFEQVLSFTESVTSSIRNAQKRKKVIDQVTNILNQLKSKYNPREWLIWPDMEECHYINMGFVDNYAELRNRIPELEGVV